MNTIIRHIAFIFILLFISCNNTPVADFKITNKTNSQIDSLFISPNKTNQYISLKPDETKFYQCDMTEINAVDGAYEINYTLNNKKHRKTFGYYTNGIPLEQMTSIKIQEDTIFFDI